MDIKYNNSNMTPDEFNKSGYVFDDSSLHEFWHKDFFDHKGLKFNLRFVEHQQIIDNIFLISYTPQCKLKLANENYFDINMSFMNDIDIENCEVFVDIIFKRIECSYLKFF